RIVALRSRLIRDRLSGHGAMLSVLGSAEEVRALVGDLADRIAVAAVNGPRTVTVAGEPAALTEFERRLSRAGVQRWQLGDVDFAAHSPQVDGILDELRELLAPVWPQPASVPFYSTVTAARLDPAELDGEYWCRNLRAPVEFAATVVELLGDEYGAFLEASAHPVLTPGINELAEQEHADAVSLGTLRREDGSPERFLRSLAEAHAHGLPVDWTTVFGQGAAVDLPTYAFQRDTYWVEAAPPERRGDGGETPAGDELWAAIGRGDRAELAALLDLGDTQRSALDDLLPALSSWRRRSTVASTLDAWRYREDWKPLRLPAPEPGGHWLVLATGEADGQ
ncbi:acyltransferase domain-containing protein, partial [Amycolatopsis sp. SID8362]|uniref:acyltransferase domain-containing protein n=1 Tax=Amycolatopsis sp. SID8362 TaxID=2690346 RepID=UPI00136C7404